MPRRFALIAVRRKTKPVEASRLFNQLAALCSCAAVILSLPRLANAAEWSVKPSLNLIENYSDNVRRSPKGQEQSDWISQLSPGLILTGDGPKLKLNTRYTMQKLLYAKNKQSDSTRHNLNANAHSELVNEQLFLDGTASISQQNTAPLGPQTLNNFNISANRADVMSYSISPYLKHRFHGFANGELRFNHAAVNTTASGLANNQTDSISLNLGNGYSFTSLLWGMNYNKQKSSYGSMLQAINSETYSGSLGYKITPHFALNATAGNEKNDYISIAKRPQGAFYSAGFTWSPSLLTSIKASAGQRFYGSSFSLNARHSSRQTTWSLDYSEDVTTTQAQFLNNAGLPAQPLPGASNFLSNQVFLQKRLTASVAINGRRNAVIFNLFDSLRDAQTSQVQNLSLLGTANQALGNQSKQLGGNASWNHQIGPYTSANLTVGYTKNNFPALRITGNDKNIQLSVNTKLQADLSSSISLLHNQYNSSQPNTDVRENAIIASLLMQF